MSEASPLRFAGVDVGYDDGPVVRGADLLVGAGRVVGLVGPNGAGKSTLLRAVTGAAGILAGDVELCGDPVGSLTERQRARLVAVVPQSTAAPFAFPSFDFVEMGRHAHLPPLGGPGERDRRVVEYAMRRTDTWRLAAERVDTLSGGDLQRLVLAQALAQEPRVLLLDEPVSHLDLNHRLQILDLVRELADAGLAVLAVFHDLDLAARYSDELAVVHEGALGPAGPPRAVLTARNVSEVFGVRAVIGTDPVTGSATVTPVLRDEAVAPTRDQEVFVVGGAGHGARLLRSLALAGFRVSCGALELGDTDQAVAQAVRARHVTLPAFGSPDPAALSQTETLAASADIRVVSATPFGRGNIANLRAAVRAGDPLVLVGGMGPRRDFGDGEATALWREALDAGAVAVDDDDGALAEVAHVLGGSADVPHR